MSDTLTGTLTKTEILERVGDISQICDARRKLSADGRSAGVETFDVTTGSGLSFSIVPSRGLDISSASYKGEPVAWRSAVGDVSPAFFEPDGLAWLRGFFGGLLTTCGMTYSSHPCEDEGEQLGLHGRVSNIPADDVGIVKEWHGDEYSMTVSGKVREAIVLGNKLELSRSITTSLGSNSLVINDTVENIGFTESPLMMLYHVNIGWPVVSEYTRLYSPTKTVKPLGDFARSEIDQWSDFTIPQADYSERVYLHDMAVDDNGMVLLALINERLKRGVYLRYPRAEFPYFIQWKMMSKGEYVVGIEPGNITGHRAYMRKEGTLEFIKPGTKRSFNLEIGVLDGTDSIGEIIETIKAVN
ncbi:aldose 1-epimerase family protein [Candidatus Latescibacterota bacterium]